MRIPTLLLSMAVIVAAARSAPSSPARRRATAKGVHRRHGPGWRTLGAADFAPVNGYPDTWKWDGEILKSTGVPIGVMRTRDQFLNFELVIEWRHMKSAGTRACSRGCR